MLVFFKYKRKFCKKPQKVQNDKCQLVAKCNNTKEKCLMQRLGYCIYLKSNLQKHKIVKGYKY